MLEYKILNQESLNGLTFLVNKELKNGWILQGGVAFSMNTYGQVFAQAMILPKKDIKS